MAGFMRGVKRVGSFVLDSFRESADKHLDDAAFDERIVVIKKATAAMIEAGVNEQRVIEMLQKHWDLRLTEAKAFVEDANAEDRA